VCSNSAHARVSVALSSAPSPGSSAIMPSSAQSPGEAALRRWDLDLQCTQRHSLGFELGSARFALSPTCSSDPVQDLDSEPQYCSSELTGSPSTYRHESENNQNTRKSLAQPKCLARNERVNHTKFIHITHMRQHNYLPPSLSVLLNAILCHYARALGKEGAASPALPPLAGFDPATFDQIWVTMVTMVTILWLGCCILHPGFSRIRLAVGRNIFTIVTIYTWRDCRGFGHPPSASAFGSFLVRAESKSV
jgi:hypothetical protein